MSLVSKNEWQSIDIITKILNTYLELSIFGLIIINKSEIFMI